MQFPNKEPHMVKAELKAILLKNGLESASLDDLVHDAASSLATDANNGAIDEQLNFLLTTCGWSPQDIIDRVGIP